MIRRIFPVVALALLFAPFGARRLQSQGNNLLVNPGFENGYYHHNSIPELAVPNGWRLHYLDGQGFDGIAEGTVARRPETVVWHIQSAPASERDLFFLDGSYTLKIFKPWAPLYAGLSQEVTGLQVGSQYEFTANVFVDVVESYSSAGKIPPANEPEGVLLRTGVSRQGAAWRNEQQIQYAGWRTMANTNPFHQKYVTLRHTFTAEHSAMTVWVEMASRYGYVNNGFFLDRMSLTGPGGGQSQAQVSDPTATQPPPAQATAQPTAEPPPATNTPVPPTATPAPVVVRYTVQRGDTLARIAGRYGVTLTALAQANNIRNVNFISSGQVLDIPGAGGAPVAAPPTVAPAAVAAVPEAAQIPPSAEAAASGGTYVVQRGDSLGAIAQRFGVSLAALAQANRIANLNHIYVGQALVVPGAGGGQAGAPAAQTYVVQRGDTLARIAARFGVTVAALQTANNLRNINFIYSGQVLRIP